MVNVPAGVGTAVGGTAVGGLVGIAVGTAGAGVAVAPPQAVRSMLPAIRMLIKTNNVRFIIFSPYEFE
jgi:hypothetical protein